MAYIRPEKSAEIRKALKAALPGWSFSVKIQHGTSLRVVIRSAPLDLLACQRSNDYTTEADRRSYTQVNHYYLDRWEQPARVALEKIVKICNEGNFDHSDSQTDYFHVGWYFNLAIGSWDRPFKIAEGQAAEAA